MFYDDSMKQSRQQCISSKYVRIICTCVGSMRTNS